MSRETQPISIDPWAHIADSILRAESAQEDLERLNRFHNFESISILALTGATILSFASGHPELGSLSAAVAMAAGISWAETSNEILALRTEISLLS